MYRKNVDKVGKKVFHLKHKTGTNNDKEGDQPCSSLLCPKHSRQTQSNVAHLGDWGLFSHLLYFLLRLLSDHFLYHPEFASVSIGIHKWVRDFRSLWQIFHLS